VVARGDWTKWFAPDEMLAVLDQDDYKDIIRNDIEIEPAIENISGSIFTGGRQPAVSDCAPTVGSDLDKVSVLGIAEDGSEASSTYFYWQNGFDSEPLIVRREIEVTIYADLIEYIEAYVRFHASVVRNA